MEMQNKKAFQKIDASNTDLFVYGEIRKMDLWDIILGDDPSRTDALNFKEALEKVDTPNLTVRINSPGGEVFEGLAIYNLLKEFQGNITTIVDGIAGSIASVIFMAGDKRVVPESGLIMIHNAQYGSGVRGDSNALKKYAEDLEKITQPSINIYVSKTGQKEKYIKELMDKETWLTSQEAFDLGFATTVEKNEVVQSLNEHYFCNLVRKIKMLEKLQAVEPTTPKKEWENYYRKGVK